MEPAILQPRKHELHISRVCRWSMASQWSKWDGGREMEEQSADVDAFLLSG